MEIMEGSYGGRFGIDGMDAVDTLYANTRNNPVEDIESHIPLRVERYELREDVMGHLMNGVSTNMYWLRSALRCGVATRYRNLRCVH
jgi:N-methylhydantoinase B/oxoprolinase/acetone carboxylase alpha subunit